MTREQMLISRDKIRTKLETTIQKNNLENQKIGKIVYYEGFEMFNSKQQNYKFAENEVFIVERDITQPDGIIKLYEIYDEHGTLLARADSEGKLTHSKEYLKNLKDRMDKLDKSLYKALGIEEVDHYLSREGEFAVTDKPYEQLNEYERGGFIVIDKPYEKLSEKEIEEIRAKIKEQENKKRETEREWVANDLGIDKDDITYSVEITDKRFYDIIPEARGYDGPAMLVYSKRMGQYVIGGINKTTGKFESCDRIQTSITSGETTLDLNADGHDVEEKRIDKLLRIKGEQDYAFAVDITTVGRDPFQMIRIDRYEGGNVKYISSDLETSNEYRASKNIEDIMNKQKNHEISDETMLYDQIAVEGQADINEIDPATRERDEERTQ